VFDPLVFSALVHILFPNLLEQGHRLQHKVVIRSDLPVIDTSAVSSACHGCNTTTDRVLRGTTMLVNRSYLSDQSFVRFLWPISSDELVFGKLSLTWAPRPAMSLGTPSSPPGPPYARRLTMTVMTDFHCEREESISAKASKTPKTAHTHVRFRCRFVKAPFASP